LLTEARVRTMEQIKAAGGAVLTRHGFVVSGWEGRGPTALGPSRKMMADLIDAAFVREVRTGCAICPEFQLTVFGVIGIDVWREKHPAPPGFCWFPGQMECAA
jgi:hypothetical protein